MTISNPRGETAVVLGASMAGLLAARVLADFYQAVTVVERDVLPTDPVNRRGVPQGRMIHAVQTRGLQIMDELFAGLAHELEAGRFPEPAVSRMECAAPGAGHT